MTMNSHMVNKFFLALIAVTALVACQSIPEWDKETTDDPVEDGRCPDISGRYNYEHIKWKNIRDWDPILEDDLPGNLPADRAAPALADYKPGCIVRGTQCIPIPYPSPDDFYPGHYFSSDIYNKIHKGKIGAYPGTVIVVLSRLDQTARNYHVRVDWDKEGLLGEYDFKFNDMWVCTSNKFVRTANTTLYERPDPDEIDPKDYRRIYVLSNGNIQIDRKHTFIAQWDKNHMVRYYVSLVFEKIP